MKTSIIHLLIFIPFLCFSQIQVNEIFADNGDCCLDDSLETEDFLELINNGESPIDIAGYYFGDQDGGSIIPSGFPEETTISGGQILLLWFDNDPEQGPLHIDAKLNNDGETIIGADTEGNEIINIAYGPQSEDVSFASFPDGELYDIGWQFTMCPTPGTTNESCPLLEGCTSENAINYNVDATIEDGTCAFETSEGIIINEYSASNCDNNGSDCGDYEDWIELYNNSSTAIDLEGYYVSDKINNPTKWQFPNTLTLNPLSHIVIYASGLDPDLEISDNNTNFKLTQTKGTEYVIISSPEGEILDYKKLVHHQLNHSVGRETDASPNWTIFSDASPDDPNQESTPYTDYTKMPEFNYEPGFYVNSIDVSISCDDNNVSIYYTLDGSFPDDSSNLYATIDANGNIAFDTQENINISSTTVIKAIAYSTNISFLPSFTETNTYFINESHGVVVLSIAGQQVDNLLNGNGWLRPLGSFELFDESGILIDEAVGEFNEHGNDSWAYDQRGLDYITRDQYGYNYAINDKLFTNRKVLVSCDSGFHSSVAVMICYLIKYGKVNLEYAYNSIISKNTKLSDIKTKYMYCIEQYIILLTLLFIEEAITDTVAR